MVVAPMALAAFRSHLSCHLIVASRRSLDKSHSRPSYATPFHVRSSLSTRWILGFIDSNSALSFAVGVKPYFSSARSDKYSPATPQASRPTPKPSLALKLRFWYALFNA